MTRAMMVQSKLPQKFYGEAILCGTYLLNREGEVSRYEKFRGKKPRLDHIHPFGTICYAFIPTEQRNKVDAIREKCRVSRLCRRF
jgi:hypothetical protein